MSPMTFDSSVCVVYNESYDTYYIKQYTGHFVFTLETGKLYGAVPRLKEISKLIQ